MADSLAQLSDYLIGHRRIKFGFAHVGGFLRLRDENMELVIFAP